MRAADHIPHWVIHGRRLAAIPACRDGAPMGGLLAMPIRDQARVFVPAANDRLT